ncbi:MAG: hypothetical protein JWN85_2946 [Gammaproteobacteria bacterium]|jgi:hypothetical protein|nr:hypothetical protein [Gammaproteobacteria bacterium]
MRLPRGSRRAFSMRQIVVMLSELRGLRQRFRAGNPAYDTGSSYGTEHRNTAPCGTFVAADKYPPCATTTVRLIDNPSPWS